MRVMGMAIALIGTALLANVPAVRSREYKHGLYLTPRQARRRKIRNQMASASRKRNR